MNKYKVVFVVSAMNLGGAQRVVAHLSSYFSDLGWAVEIVATYSGVCRSHYALHPNVRLIHLSRRVSGSASGLLGSVKRILALRKFIKDQEPDFVISLLTVSNIASMLSCIGLTPKLYISERNYPPFRTVGAVMLRAISPLIRRVDAVIAQTNESKLWFRKAYPNVWCDTIPNPVMYPLASSTPVVDPSSYVDAESKIFLCAGRLVEQKQFHIAILAFKHVVESDSTAKLVIVGEGHLRESLSSLIASLSLVGKVFLPGKVGNMADWYERASVFVLCSSHEGFPNVLLEAMSYGAPVVSFDCNSGPRDIVIDGTNGFLVDQKEGWEGLAEKMLFLIGSFELRAEMSIEALKVRNRYSITRVCSLWHEALVRQPELKSK